LTNRDHWKTSAEDAKLHGGL